MRRTHLHLLILSALLVVAVIAAGSHLQSGKLFAMQQPANSSQGSAAGSNSNYGTVSDTPDATGSQGAQPAVTQEPAVPDQARTEPARAGMPWGWIIGSFIAGLIVGGILFSGGRGTGVRYSDRDLRDRDDFRRSA